MDQQYYTTTTRHPKKEMITTGERKKDPASFFWNDSTHPAEIGQLRKIKTKEKTKYHGASWNVLNMRRTESSCWRFSFFFLIIIFCFLHSFVDVARVRNIPHGQVDATCSYQQLRWIVNWLKVSLLFKNCFFFSWRKGGNFGMEWIYMKNGEKIKIFFVTKGKKYRRVSFR